MLTCVYCHGEIKESDFFVAEIGNLHAECKDTALNFKMLTFMNPSTNEIDLACKIWIKRNT